MNIFPEFQYPHLYFSLFIEQIGENGIEDGLLGYNLPSSQFIIHLNRMPMKIQFLPLLLVW